MFFVLQPAQSEKPDIARLIENYSKELTRLCYLILKDVHLAEEAAWDTLYKAYRGHSRFRGGSSEKTWITRIAINVCKSYMRKASYRENSGGSIPLDYVSDDQARAEYCSDEALELLNAVYALPVKYKQVILLKYYQQLTVSEISKVLKEKENTISVRLKRAHDMLKEALKEDL
ncbi:MAG: sigma-70 family RNA polymerase sigma factor [Bacillota bacterium]|nr:sigma-70 family RNA polymerase sigma factor [Bacillota bacterium]